MFEWLALALVWNVIWATIYVSKPKLRRQMLWVSFFTMLTGLTQPLFVPNYWTPPSLFNLAATTRFDIESLIYSWGVGGVGSVLYGITLNLQHRQLAPTEKQQERKWLHLISLTALPIVFGVLTFGTGLNPIYCVSAGLFAGAIGAVVCRQDLAKNTLIGGLSFTILYFIVFYFIILIFPSFMQSWNLPALTGILFLGVPLEEIMFSFSFGMMWSTVYEHIRNYTLNNQQPTQTA
jgi:hypothetical protein